MVDDLAYSVYINERKSGFVIYAKDDDFAKRVAVQHYGKHATIQRYNSEPHTTITYYIDGVKHN